MEVPSAKPLFIALSGFDSRHAIYAYAAQALQEPLDNIPPHPDKASLTIYNNTLNLFVKAWSKKETWTPFDDRAFHRAVDSQWGLASTGTCKYLLGYFIHARRRFLEQLDWDTQAGISPTGNSPITGLA